MSVTYGFYNSIKGDRKYNALEMSSIFDGIIVDGVYMSIGDALNVKSSGGMGITVGIGRAWFNHTWTLNDSLLPLTLANSDVLLNRIDAIVLEVNNNTDVRKNTIKILKGTPSSKPVKPTMTEGELLNQHPLAYISIPAGATSISQSNIENAVGTSACPYVTGVLKGMDIDKLVAQWGAQWAEWLSSNTNAWKAFMSDNTNEWKSFMAKNKNEWSALINGNTSEFETWFEHMKDQLSEDAAGNLQLQVDNLNNAALGGDFVLKGSSVSVEYMGANRIAAITAYGETPQGGTTAAPVALTGVDSVQVCGRNLLPCVETSGVTNGITKTVNTDGSITLSGTATDRVVIFITNQKSHIVLSKGTYTIGIGVTIPDGCVIALGHYHGNKYIGGLMGMSAGKSYKSFQVSNITGVLEGYFEIKSGTTINTTIYPMLNLGESPLPYESYQGNVTALPIPRPLHEVGDVRDVCRTRVKSIYDKRVVLDGTEDWKVSSMTSGMFFIEREINPGTAAICSNFVFSKSATTEQGKIYIVNNQIRFLTSYETLESWKAFLTAQKEAGTPVTVYYQSTAYGGTNGLDVCLTEYQNGFVELDGTENWRLESETNCFLLDRGLLNGKFDHNEATVICDRYKSDTYINRTTPCVYAYNYGGASLGFADNQYDSVDSWKSYLAAQKAAGTPVQVAYQLATPETYATDPIDFDNAAGPLTVLTGGAVEVRMTELVGSRSPELAGKMDKATYDADGDGVVDKAAAVPWDGVTGKPGTFTPSTHNHDDRYYTETEMNTKLNGKANSIHTHTKDQVGLSKVNNNSISMGLSGTDLWVYYS